MHTAATVSIRISGEAGGAAGSRLATTHAQAHQAVGRAFVHQLFARVGLDEREHMIPAVKQEGEIQRHEGGHEVGDGRGGDDAQVEIAKLDAFQQLAVVPKLTGGVDFDLQAAVAAGFHRFLEGERVLVVVARFGVDVAEFEHDGRFGCRRRCRQCEQQAQGQRDGQNSPLHWLCSPFTFRYVKRLST